MGRGCGGWCAMIDGSASLLVVQHSCHGGVVVATGGRAGCAVLLLTAL